MPVRKSTRAAAASVLEPLEGRRYLSTINWVNKGTGPGAGDTDSFNAIFGANATVARSIVQRGIDDWERVITDFNGTGGRNTFTLNVTATNLAGNVAADANITAFDALNKPSAADIRLDSTAAASGWYFDPDPGTAQVPEDSDFTSFVTPFAADRTTSSGRDLYRSFIHELSHALGISGSATRLTALESNAGDDPLSTDPVDVLKTIDIDGNGSADFTLTTSGGRHFYEGGGGYTGPSHPNEIINAGRAVSSAQVRRGLISDNVAGFLRDVFDYTIQLPSTINTFYVNFNNGANSVTVNGDMDPTGDDNDNIDLEVSGTAMRFEVNGTSETIEGVQFGGIIVNAGDGADDIDVDQLISGKTVTVNGQDGNDRIQIAPQFGDIDSDLLSDVSANGGSGTDTITFNDSADGAGADTYTITSPAVQKGARTISHLLFESVQIANGSPQPSTYDIDSTSPFYTLQIVAGGATDTFNVGSGDYDSSIFGDIDIDALVGGDVLNIDDSADAGSGAYTLTHLAFSKTSGGTLSYDSISAISIDGSDQASLYNVDFGGNTVTGVTISAGAGNDTLDLGGASDDLDNAMASPIDWRGQGGADKVDLNDSGDSPDAESYVLTGTSFSKSSAGAELLIAGTEAIHLVANGGDNTVTVEFGNIESGQSVTVGAGGGNDHITSLVPGTFSLLPGDVTLQGGAGTDTITLDDSVGSLADQYSLSVNTVQAFTLGSPSGLVNYTAEILDLSTSGAASTIRVESTAAATDYTLRAGDGDDTINFGGTARDVSAIDGEVTVFGGAGDDRINYNDDNSATNNTYTVSPDNLSRTGAAVVDPNGIEAVVVNAGSGADLFNVPATLAATPVTLNGNGGNDTFRVANGIWDNAIAGPVTVNGGNGFDELDIDDTSDTGADNYAVTATQASKSAVGAGTIDYGTIEQLELDANHAANVINVNGTFLGTTVIRGNNGDDSINVADNAATTFVAVDGGAGLDNVSVNADAAGAAAVQFSSTQDLNNLAIGPGGTARLNPGGLLLDVQGAVSAGTLDLTDGGYIDRGGTAILNAYVTQLTAGYNAGAWNGAAPAIVSSSAAASTLADALGYAAAGSIGAATFMGSPVAANDLLIRYTLYGDANLDRAVNIADFSSLAANFNTSATWARGNFNYDTLCDIGDFSLLAANYNQSLPAAPARTPPTSPFGRRVIRDARMDADRPMIA